MFLRKKLLGALALAACLVPSVTLTAPAEAGTCYLSNSDTTFAAIVESEALGPFTIVETRVQRYTFGDASLICGGSSLDAFFSDNYGAVQFQACGFRHYIGSGSAAQTVGSWTSDCDPVFVSY